MSDMRENQLKEFRNIEFHPEFQAQADQQMDASREWFIKHPLFNLLGQNLPDPIPEEPPPLLIEEIVSQHDQQTVESVDIQVLEAAGSPTSIDHYW